MSVSFRRLALGRLVTLTLVVIAVGALVSTPQAGGRRPLFPGSETFEKSPITVDVRAPWPAGLSTGWAPVLVEITNDGSEERTVALELAGRRSHGNLVRQSVACPPGRTTLVELAVPVFGTRSGYELQAVLGRERLDLNVPIINQIFGPGQSPLLVLSPAGTAPGEPRFDVPTIEWTVRGGATEQIQAYSYAHASFAEAARRFEAYSSLEVVVLDLRSGHEPALELTDTILAWARAGGLVVIWHGQARARALELSGVAPWLEERFEVEPGLFAFGLGHLLLAPDENWFDAGGDPLTPQARLLDRFARKQGVRDLPAAGPGWFASLSDLSRLPYRVLVFVLILFAVLIGPINFLAVKASGRQHLLLLTIPIIAAVASISLFVYGLIHQGLDVKRARFAYTVLDQREHRAATIATETLFAGWVPGGGMRPGPRTAVVPKASGGFRDTPSYIVDLADEKRLTGGFLPARRRALYSVFTETSARGRLAFTRDADGAGGYGVENGLGCAVRALALRDEGGDVYLLVERMEEGGQGHLAPITSAVDYSDFKQALGWSRVAAPDDGGPSPFDFITGPSNKEPPTPEACLPVVGLDDLWPGSYIALVVDGPFADDLGLESVPSGGWEIVVGVLDARELGE